MIDTRSSGGAALAVGTAARSPTQTSTPTTSNLNRRIASPLGRSRGSVSPVAPRGPGGRHVGRGSMPPPMGSRQATSAASGPRLEVMEAYGQYGQDEGGDLFEE